MANDEVLISDTFEDGLLELVELSQDEKDKLLRKFKEIIGDVDWRTIPILPYNLNNAEIESYSDVAMWAVDLLRAAREQPLWARVLLRIALGKFAYREWVGLMDCLNKHLMSPYDCYCLQDIEYHRDSVPFDWAKERTPKKVK